MPLCKFGQVRQAASDSFPFGITSAISSPLGSSYEDSPRYEPISPSFPPGLGYDFGGMAEEATARGAENPADQDEYERAERDEYWAQWFAYERAERDEYARQASRAALPH